MVESLFPNLPYEMIGMATFAIIALVIAFIVGLVLLIGFYLVWSRAWVRVSDSMYTGYDTPEEMPPRWKIRIAGVTVAIARFKFTKIPAVFSESTELANDEETILDALSNRFVDKDG